MVCDKDFECTEHSSDRNSPSVVPSLCPHTARRQHITCRSSAGRCSIIIHPIVRTSCPVISIFSYTRRNSCPVRVSIFRMTERRRRASQWFQSQAADFYDAGYKIWPHGMTNVSIAPPMDRHALIYKFQNTNRILVFWTILLRDLFKSSGGQHLWGFPDL